ncbi:MAG: HAMP domain-containing protein [Rhodospirillales bacterium]|nr:HAMP domain-containing protein [Rhodospirillales bacterium]QQS13335.1 MAG: HAMP domain-containing protein [Rhodospirillales bacterium]
MSAPAAADVEARRLTRRYYLAMSTVFFVDVAITAIFSAVHRAPGLFALNAAIDMVVLLGLNLLGARALFAPIRAFLAGKRPFDRIERDLTQLPLKSAVWVMGLSALVFAERLLLPRILGATSSGVPLSTWLDVVVTFTVQTLFHFVLTYFLVSGYLARLCRAIFDRHGRNMTLFFGSFTLKAGVALVFSSVGPLALVAADVYSYEGARLHQEAAVDLLASLIGLPITIYWVSRSLAAPLRRLDAGIGRVADGDLSARLPATSNDEVGRVTAEFNRMVEGLGERQRIRETFGKYVSESVASALLRGSGDGRLIAETRTATVLFTDIEGFTGIAEWLPADDLVAAINEYLALILEPIQRHGGVVNGFIGDGLMASFNLPLANDDHAAAAVAAAIEIERLVADRTFSGVAFATRIGVNTGEVIGGTVGAGDRLGYTLLGDAVNTAARLEQLNKEHGTRILVAGSTRDLCGDRFAFRGLGAVSLRGRAGSALVYAIDAPPADAVAT